MLLFITHVLFISGGSLHVKIVNVPIDRYTEHCAACSNQTQTARVYHNATALPANTKTWPNVVSMLVQRRWRWAISETALGQILAFAGLHTGVCLHSPLPHHNILASRSEYF